MGGRSLIAFLFLSLLVMIPSGSVRLKAMAWENTCVNSFAFFSLYRTNTTCNNTARHDAMKFNDRGNLETIQVISATEIHPLQSTRSADKHPRIISTSIRQDFAKEW